MGELLHFPRARAHAISMVAPAIVEDFQPTHRFGDKLYAYVCMSRDCTSGQEMVTFRARNGQLWSCTRAGFEGLDRFGRPNFVPLRRMIAQH